MVEWALATYLLTVLIPINGLIFLGMRRERIRNKKIMLSLWRMRK